jgi:predicted nucleic acid-binding protein
MNAVVDTNVVAYYLLGTEPYAYEASEFWRSLDEPIAPAHWQAELANVLWMAVKTGALAPQDGHRRLDFASRLRIRAIPIGVLWQAALALAVESGISAYDTLFVALARRRNVRLATFDRQLIKTFPDIAQRPASLLR